MKARSIGIAAAVAAILLAGFGWLWAEGHLVGRKSPAAVATAWGLTGVWQQVCEKPAAVDNPRYDYAVVDGELILRRDFGGVMKDTSTISDAAALEGGGIDTLIHFVELGESRKERVNRRNVVIRSGEGQIRVWSNKDADTGAETVVNGIRKEDLDPTPWMSRCGRK